MTVVPMDAWEAFRATTRSLSDRPSNSFQMDGISRAHVAAQDFRRLVGFSSQSTDRGANVRGIVRNVGSCDMTNRTQAKTASLAFDISVGDPSLNVEFGKFTPGERRVFGLDAAGNYVKLHPCSTVLFAGSYQLSG
jgi:hypothetical protein